MLITFLLIKINLLLRNDMFTIILQQILNDRLLLVIIVRLKK